MANIISKLTDLLEDYKKQLVIKKLYETRDWEESSSKIEKNYTSLWTDESLKNNKESSSKNNTIFNFNNNDDIDNSEDDFSWGRNF